MFWSQNNRPKFIHRAGRILTGIIAAGIIFSLLTQSIYADRMFHSWQQTGPAAIEAWLWFLIAGSGMFGGFLYGIRDRSLVLPHRKSKYVFEPGFIGDCLFGLAGGFLIFILLPGNFDYGAGIWELLKIVAVAVVGGYGGRALVAKMLSQQFQELEEDIEALRSQNKQGGMAFTLLNQHLDNDLDTPAIPEEELKEAILAAPASIKVLAFNMAHEFRNNNYERYPERIERCIPIFEALIEDDTANKFHRNHGELAYVLKDKTPPDWKRAEEELTTAIDIRNKGNDTGFRLYEFNRAICRIHLQFPFNDIKNDLDEALPWPRTGDLIRKPDAVKGKALIEWMLQNYDKLEDWIARNRINLPQS
jgi:hypothetical protein